MAWYFQDYLKWATQNSSSTQMSIKPTNKASNLKITNKKATTTTQTTPAVQTQPTSANNSGYYQALQQKKQELQNKLNQTQQATTQSTPKVLNFWLWVSQKWVTNVNEYNPVTKKTENIFAPNQTTPTTQKSSWFSLIPTANASSDTTGGLHLFTDESKAYNKMIQSWVNETHKENRKISW